MPNPEDVTPTRRRDERVFHPELLEPIVLPRMREPQVIIGMDDYRNYERFLDVFVSIENAIARGRLEARIEAYEMVLHQVEMNDTLSAVRQPGLIEKLQNIIRSWREDLVRLEIEAQPAKPPTSAPAELSEDEVTMFMSAMDNPRVHTLAERLRRGFAHVMSVRAAPVG